MNIERFKQDKEISDIGERIMMILMTAKDFGLDKPETLRFVVQSFTMMVFSELANRKDLTPKGIAETKQLGYSFIGSMCMKCLRIQPSPDTDIFMLDYMNSNKDKLLNEALELLNNGKETVN